MLYVSVKGQCTVLLISRNYRSLVNPSALPSSLVLSVLFLLFRTLHKL